MNRHTSKIIKLVLVMSLGMIGCQPAAPRKGMSFNSNFSSGYNPFTTSAQDYSNLINNGSGSSSGTTTSGTTVPADSAACQSYSTKTQRLVESCSQEIDYYYDDIQAASPSCLDAFYSLSPYNCGTLGTQLSTLRNTCGSLLYANSSALPNCYNAMSNF